MLYNVCVVPSLVQLMNVSLPHSGVLFGGEWDSGKTIDTNPLHIQKEIKYDIRAIKLTKTGIKNEINVKHTKTEITIYAIQYMGRFTCLCSSWTI